MKLKLFIKYISGILFFIISQGCEEKIDWDFQSNENKALVVDAIITNEFKHQEVRLTLSYSDQNGNPEPATGAQIVITDSQNSTGFIEAPVAPGRYFSVIPFAAQPGRVYEIFIEYNGQFYHAENEMIPVYPFYRMTFNPFGNDSLTVGEVAPIYSPDEQAMYEVYIDWSHITDVEPTWAKLFFFTFSTIDVNQLFQPDKETVAFPRGSIVLERKYSLNDEFAAFYRALAMETAWQGGVFDENSASLPTNISNGGLGFFGVSAVLSDTLIAQ